MSTIHAVNGSVCSTGFSPVLSRSYKGQILFTQYQRAHTAVFKDSMFKNSDAVNFETKNILSNDEMVWQTCELAVK